MKRRDFLRSTLAAPALLSIPGLSSALHAQADKFPSQPIRMIWPGGGGGAPYAIVRMIAQKAEASGATIIVEDRPGTTVGSVAVKEAKPDGYTIMIGRNSTHAANVTLIKDLPYHPLTDFAPITNLFVMNQALVVPASLGVNTVDELRDLARKTPGGLSYASPGLGSGAQLMAAMLAKSFDAPMTHVPYRSSPAVLPDLLSGRVHLFFNTLRLFQDEIALGRIKVLAVASDERFKANPDVPTLAEQGYPDIAIESWSGVFAPAKTSPERVNTLNAMFVKAAQSIAEQVESRGFTIRTSTPEEFRSLVKTDIERLAKIIKEVGAAP